MTSYVGRVITALSSALEFNSATLSGAIDIIVIEDEKGTRKCSPFHVRFGKLQLLKAGGCPVTVELNGRSTKLNLFLAPAGEAYFYTPPKADEGERNRDGLADFASETVSPCVRGEERVEGGEEHVEGGEERVGSVGDCVDAGRADAERADAGRADAKRADAELADAERADAECSGGQQSSPGPTDPSTSSSHGAAPIPFDPTSQTPRRKNRNSIPISPWPASTTSSLTATPSIFSGTEEAIGAMSRRLSAPLPTPQERLDAPILSAAMDAVSSPALAIPVIDGSDMHTGSGYVSDSEVEVSKNEREGAIEVVDEPRSPPVGTLERRLMQTYERSRSLRERKKLNTSTKIPLAEDKFWLVATDQKSRHLLGESLGESRGEMSGCDGEVSSAHGGGDGDVPDGHANSQEGQETRLRWVDNANEPVSPKTVADDSVFGMDAVGGKAGNPVSSSSSSTSVHKNDLESVTISPDAENLTVAAEEAKLEMRSLDGYEDDDLLDGGTACLGVSELPRNPPPPDIGGPRPEELSRALSNALGKTDSSESAIARRSKARSVTMDESYMEHVGQNSMPVMSLCGHLVNSEMDEDELGILVVTHRVKYEEFASDPNLLFNPDMLFCLNDRLVEFRIAAPFVMSSLAFRVPLDIDRLAIQMNAAPLSLSLGRSVGVDEGKAASGDSKAKAAVAMDSKEKGKQPEAIKSGGRFGWFGWSRGAEVSSAPIGEPLLSEEDLLSLDATPTESANRTPLPGERDSSNNEGNSVEKQWNVISSEIANIPEPERSSAELFGEISAEHNSPHYQSVRDLAMASQPNAVTAVAAVQDFAQAATSQVTDAIVHPPSRADSGILENSFMPDPKNLSLVPTAGQLADLDLKPGANTIRFIVEASAAEVECRIFLWGPDVKIVISDVDGTITRSDVLGHVLPAVGRDWSQVGVAGLYSEIAKHGYKFMYLTARPIGMASTTRDFLHSVVQGGSRLPNGPVLMSPNRLVESFTREVIRRKPQEFKIAALREVRSLFTMDYNPFHAGFGNRETDVISYRAVGLIPHRIFVVNTAAELVINSVRFESTASYDSLRDLVNSVFPDIDGKVGREHVMHITDQASFNSWNYWKPDLPEIDLDALLARN